MGRARTVGVPLGVVLSCALIGCSDPSGDSGGPNEPAPSDSTRSEPAPTARTTPDSPTAAETPTTSSDNTAGPITVTVVGDVMLGREVGESVGSDPGQVLRPTADRLSRADLSVATLESTLSRLGPPTQGSDSFAASPAVLGPLKNAGFDALSLANNHVGDFGQRSLIDTVRRLRGADLTPFGAGTNAAEAWRPVVLERSGVRVGIVGFNAIGETPRATVDGPGAAEVRMPPRTGPLSSADLTRARRAVGEAQRRADVVIAMPHWGEQYTHQPVSAQQRVGRMLVEAGADAVIGGHPHWVQRVESHRGRPIVHSLGNFVFDMDWERQVREGVAAELTVADSEVTAVRLVPYRIDESYTPRWVRGAAARRILAEMGAPAGGVLPVP